MAPAQRSRRRASSIAATATVWAAQLPAAARETRHFQDKHRGKAMRDDEDVVIELILLLMPFLDGR